MFCMYISYAANTFQDISFIYLFTCRVVLGVMGAIAAKPATGAEALAKFCFWWKWKEQNYKHDNQPPKRGVHIHTRNMTINFFDYIIGINTNITTTFNKYQYLELGVS